MKRLVKFVSRLKFIAGALARVEKAEVLERVRLESIGKQVALDAMAHELGRASKAGIYWREKASENSMMAILLLASKPSGYVVVPKDCIDGKKYGYSIEVQDREDAIRFKLIKTRKTEEKKGHLSVVPPLSKDEAS